MLGQDWPNEHLCDHAELRRRQQAPSVGGRSVCAVVAVCQAAIGTSGAVTMLSAAPNGSLLAAAAKPAAPPARRSSQRHVCRASSADRCSDTLQRRQALAALVAVTAAAMGSGATQPAAAASDFVQTASGLLIQDIT